MDRLEPKPIGKGKALTLSIGESVGFGEGIGADQDGPLTQTRLSLLPDGRTSKVELDKSAGWTDQEATGPVRASSKPEEERQVAERFIAEYNRLRGTDFSVAATDLVEADSVDALAQNSGGQRLKMQIRCADDRPWTALGVTEKYGNQESIEETCTSLRKAIQDKSSTYPPAIKADLILLLDGWPDLPPKLVEGFVALNSGWLAQHGFLEIWYVPRGPGSNAICLDSHVK